VLTGYLRLIYDFANGNIQKSQSFCFVKRSENPDRKIPEKDLSILFEQKIIV
jgi:hypothetical protein